MKLDLNCERGPRFFGDCKTNSIPGRYCGRYYDSLVGIVRGSLGGEGFSCAHTCVLGQDKPHRKQRLIVTGWLCPNDEAPGGIASLVLGGGIIAPALGPHCQRLYPRGHKDGGSG